MTFQPGQSGNPQGRRREKPFADALKLAVSEATNNGDRKKLRDIADALVTKAAAGDVQAIKEIADRMDGKVPQGIIGGDEDDPPIQITRVELVAASDNSSN